MVTPPGGSDQFRRDFTAVMKAGGFRTKNRRFYRHSDEAIVAVDLQGSVWGGSFYINFGILIRQLPEDGRITDPEFPLPSNGHIYGRIVELAPDQSRQLNEVLNLESPLEYSVRLALLDEILSTEVIPFLNECTSIDFLRSDRAIEVWKTVLTTRSARDLLRIPDR